MLIRYGKKRKNGNDVDYESRALADGKVMVSYDALAIYADKIRFDRKKFTLSAQGDVIVEDGTQRIKANSVTVRFNNGAAEVTTN
jgi:lipopolysaccharide export system protein LptA